MPLSTEMPAPVSATTRLADGQIARRAFYQGVHVLIYTHSLIQNQYLSDPAFRRTFRDGFSLTGGGRMV